MNNSSVFLLITVTLILLLAVLYFFYKRQHKLLSKKLSKSEQLSVAATDTVTLSSGTTVTVTPPASQTSPTGTVTSLTSPTVTVQEISDTKPMGLVEAMAKTRQSFWGRIKSTITGKVITDQDIEALEEILYTSDLGPRTVTYLMNNITEKISADNNTLADLRKLLKEEMYNIFTAVESAAEVNFENGFNLKFNPEAPTVWLFVGVNGSGKTTTIGKLANKLALIGKKVLVVAGDTFRAAAGEQLKVWAERARVEIFSPEDVKDPSAVVFDACQKALAKKFDVVLVDTAGRLHTQKNLMEEIKKMKRVVKKAIPSAPDEIILILDANSGQNGLIQAREFGDALDVSGVILTKLDGTAKGGVVVGVAAELKLPVKLIGIGEKINDLRPFSPREFVDSIVD